MGKLKLILTAALMALFSTAFAQTTVSIGTGTDDVNFPYDFNYHKSLTQTIYLQSEIGETGGFITGLSYTTQPSFYSNQEAMTSAEIEIWIGETNLTDLSAGFIDPTGFTRAFARTEFLDMYDDSQKKVNIVLTTPYEYKGGNLVIYSYKYANNWTGSSYQFLGTSGTNRSRYIRTDDSGEYDMASYWSFNVGSTGVVNSYPNIAFTFVDDISSMSSLTGVVKDDSDNPIEVARVQIVGSNRYAMTNASGVYTLFLEDGTYDITVSKPGYVAQTIQNIAIAAGETTTQNVTLQAMPAFEISGKVTNAANNAPIVGIAITLTMAADPNFIETTATDANGDYSFSSGIYDGITYQLSVNWGGWESYSGTITINDNNETHNISMVKTPTIGTGTDEIDPPYNFGWYKSLTQTIYLQSEIGETGGSITELSYAVSSTFNGSHGALSNAEIEIWIGETDLTSLSAGFIDPTGFTRAFARTAFLDTYDNDEKKVNIVLTTPYEYQGGNLVIYSYKYATSDIWPNTNTFLGTSAVNRSRYIRTDNPGEYDMENPESNHGMSAGTSDFYPNITFTFADASTTGSLTGIVKDESNNPIEGARVQVVGSSRYAMTNASGIYTLQNLSEGTYDITVSKFRYVTETYNVVIVAGETTTQNATLQAAQEEEPQTYNIAAGTTSGTFTATNTTSGTPVAVAGATDETIANVINAIRADAGVADVTIHLEDLDIGTDQMVFNNSTAPNIWGTITLTGSITSASGAIEGTVGIGAGVSAVSTANIANTRTGANAAIALYKTGAGKVTINGGTISSTGAATSQQYGVINLASAASVLEINGGKIVNTSTDVIIGGTAASTATINIAPTVAYIVSIASNDPSLGAATLTSGRGYYGAAETITATTTPTGTNILKNWTVGTTAISTGDVLSITAEDLAEIIDDISDVALVANFAPTHIATLNILKDGTAWEDHGKSFTLQLDGKTIALSGTDEQLTARVYDGVWKLYDGSTDTGVEIEIDGAAGEGNVSYFTVTFKDHDGTVLGTSIAIKNLGATAPTNPTRMGHTFTGWDKTFTNITEPTTVTAVYEENSTPILATFTGQNIRIYATSNGITLENVPMNTKVEVYNLRGERVYIGNSGNSQILKILVQTKGIYMVNIGGKTVKVVR